MKEDKQIVLLPLDQVTQAQLIIRLKINIRSILGRNITRIHEVKKFLPRIVTNLEKLCQKKKIVIVQNN